MKNRNGKGILAGKRRIAYFVFICCCLNSGCGRARSETTGEKAENKMMQEEYHVEVTSVVRPEDCYICGNREESLMPYYAKRDSIGILYWNEMDMIDSDVRAYDDDGNELFGQNSSGMSICSFGDGCGSISVDGTPNRGFTRIKVYYEEKDELDFAAVRKMVCQQCLDKAAEFYEDQKNAGEDSRIATTGYCLVDFMTGELYTLSAPYRGYFIRDYYVTYDITEDPEGKENCIRILILYAPEREK